MTNLDAPGPGDARHVMDSSHARHSVTSRWDMRTIMVIVSAFGALPMLGIAVLSPTFLKPGTLPLLSAITCFTAVTVIVAAAAGRLTDRQFAVLGAGGMLGVALSAYVIADPAATRAVTAMLTIVPAISASASPTRITTALTTLAVVMAAIVTVTDLAVTGTAVSLIAVGAAATTVLIPVFVIGGVTRSLRAVNTQMQQLADTDPLTGLLNRRGMLAPTLMLLDSIHRRKTGLRAAVIDIDHFKTVNDTHGHTAGDRTLVAVADTLTAILTEHSPADTVLARIGGEEFLLLTPADIDPGLETRILEQIRTDTAVTVSIGTVTAALIAGTEQHDTAQPDHAKPAPSSFGTSEHSSEPVCSAVLDSTPAPLGIAHSKTAVATGTDPRAASLDAAELVVDSLSRAADEALYRAKTTGRDRICTADPLSVVWPRRTARAADSTTPAPARSDPTTRAGARALRPFDSRPAHDRKTP